MQRNARWVKTSPTGRSRGALPHVAPQGVAHTIRIYIGVLKALAASRKFTILVHPIPPVLNETRHIVTIFNKQLAEAVKKERNLHMLDFFSQLVSSDGSALADGLQLDGTHMHPDYTKLMEEELLKAP